MSEKSPRLKMDNETVGVEEWVVCRNCKKEVRPIDVPIDETNTGDGFHTCPVCKRSLEEEIDRLETKYGLKAGMDTDLPDRGDNE